jgi:hypothetical protein
MEMTENSTITPETIQGAENAVRRSTRGLLVEEVLPVLQMVAVSPVMRKGLPQDLQAAFDAVDEAIESLVRAVALLDG